MAVPDVNTFPTVTDLIKDSDTMVRMILRVLGGAMRGKTNNVRGVTLNAGATTTDLALEREVISANSYVGFMPVTASAATEAGAGSLYVSSINDTDASVGTLAAYSIRITHANTADTDKNFRVVIVG